LGFPRHGCVGGVFLAKKNIFLRFIQPQPEN
jgi:hypothetical protein